MKTDQAALNYAKGLFQLSSEPEVLDDLNQVLKITLENPKLSRIFCAHDYTKAQKQQLFEDIFAKSLHPILLSFLKYLLEQNKFNLLSSITRSYRQLILDKIGILEVTLMTALPVNEAIKTKLASKLSAFYKKRVEIEIQIDPDIVAGAILVVGNQMIDLSLNTQISHLTKHLLAAQI